MIYAEHIKKVMDKVEFPEEAKACFNRIFDRIRNEADLRKEYYALLNEYLYKEPDMKLGDSLDKVTKLAVEYGENQYTMHMAFILSCTPRMYELYEEEGIDEEIYWEGLLDLRAKLLECMECKGVPGTFVGGWFNGWFRLTRFALGRFQYEPISYNFGKAVELPCGETLLPGNPIANMHIPSTGVPLTDEVRNASYKKAYDFLSKRFKTNKVFLCCSSWLLFGKHTEFLPEKSNILKFMSDFHLTASVEEEKFGNNWRLYGKYADGEVKDYPENNSLRRAYKKWLLDGNKTGSGWGCMMIENGINVTHKDK
ncbi:MAG: DUF5596 domain-containing protein [Clostridia bacterium]|nr:DUF5596 domain-containing protein [Clostridia bacterium]